MDLTEKQRAVVGHGEGPALVYAVAGAGKTTAMKHRIRRLVTDGCAVPSQILAVSFATANVRDLVRGLEPWPECRGANVRTIHSLSLQILNRARRLGFPVLHPSDDGGLDDRERAILYSAKREARAGNYPLARELDAMDDDDFVAYLSAAKGNLRYADLEAADLPDAGRRVACQAEAPAGREWYLDLYRLYEDVRRQNRWVTYDDMLVGAWEAMLRHQELLQRVQAFFRYLLVDEFQDVNLVQVELLGQIAGERDNYMAIGDDDQTIYEWRGASPDFIRDFGRRHPGTTEYRMDDCFRCPAAPLALANAVIERDKRRSPKRLCLTRGFVGGASLSLYQSAADQARAIAATVELERAAGRPLLDMAILVRLIAQTPALEQALLGRHIPYVVVGGKPFFARDEVRLLLDYCLLGECEATAEPTEPELRRRAWQRVYNRPRRYVSRVASEEIWTLAERGGLSLCAAIERVAARPAYERMGDALLGLRRVLLWLSGAAALPAHELLRQLEARLGYIDDLRAGAVRELAEQKAANVASFIEYARDRGSLAELRLHLVELEADWAQRLRDTRKEVLTVSTIHRAKGLEWPVVFVPDCNEGYIPCASTDNLAEERRLLYVAITRARERLYLSAQARLRWSRFLEQARPLDVLQRVERIATALSLPAERWGAEEGLGALCTDAAAFGFHSFFRRFWPASAEEKAAAACRIHSLLEAAKADRRKTRLPASAAVSAWRDISPEGWNAPLEVTETLLPEASRPGAAGQCAAPAAERPRSPDGASPDVVTAGCWLRCDAGWSRILRVCTGNDRHLDSFRPGDGHPVTLEVVLRPGHDAIEACIDLPAATMVLGRARHVYSCGHCDAFVSYDPHLISGKHNRVAHGGRGARFRRLPAARLDLTHIEYRRTAPEDELA